MNKNSFSKGWAMLWYPILLGYLLIGHTNSVHSWTLLQEKLQISGIVSDGHGTLPAVTINVKGKSTAVISSADGTYNLLAEASDTLVFSSLGYKTLIIPVANRSRINVLMLEDATALQEVTVNAGYYNVKEKERTGSIARIKASDIAKQPVNNPLAAMQGRMAGVNITQNTGTPGGGFDIQIRGLSSIRPDGNAPLYVVDGVPFASQSLGDIQVSGSILAGASSPLNNINPADIESIEVLKDADATAIYGSRGANGVVLITTKKGKGGKTSFSIHNYTGVGTVANTMKMMNTRQYLAMRREAFANDGITDYPFYAYDVNGTWDADRHTDWRKELIGGTAHFSNTQATVSGGSNTTQFLLSGTWRKETTVFPGDAYYKRAAVHGSVTHRSLDDRFRMDFSVGYSGDKNTLQASDLTAQAYTLAPNAPALYTEEGELNWEDSTFSNPLANLESRYKAVSSTLMANAVLGYKIIPSLEVKTSFGYTDTRLSESRTMPSTMYDPAYGVTSQNSLLFINNGNRDAWIAEPQLDWKSQWAKGSFNVLLGATFQSQQGSQLSQYGAGFSSNALINSIAAATAVQVTASNPSEYRYQAYFGRLNYIHEGKYIINLTGRQDGSSRFGPGKRFANFGAVGAAWLFAEEKAIREYATWLSFGKFRTSYGTTGNDQIGDYQFLDTYSVTGNNYNGVIGLQPSRLFNPDFGWETNKKLEWALEIGLFKDRIFFTGAWYRNRSSNQLVGMPLPATTGFASLQANLEATVENKGWEVELRTANFKSQNFSWTTTFNMSIPRNTLLEFKGLEGSAYANRYVIGKSLNVQKLYHFTGIDPDTGTYAFEDYDGDGNVTAPADRSHLADTSPKWFGGLGNQFRYRNWELEGLFQFVKQDGRNYRYFMNSAGSATNMAEYVTNHWPENGTGAEIQQYTTGANAVAMDAYFRYVNSSATISDASFIRLKSISLSYQIPSAWSKTFSGKIYFQGQNLLTFTKYKGADPENQSLSYLPPLKQYSLGIQLSF